MDGLRMGVGMRKFSCIVWFALNNMDNRFGRHKCEVITDSYGNAADAAIDRAKRTRRRKIDITAVQVVEKLK